MSKIVVGKFGAVHGVRGWLRVNSFTDPKTNILDLTPWSLQDGDGWCSIQIEDSRCSNENILVKVAGYDVPETARLLTNKNIGVEQSQLPSLDEGEYYWSQLKGLNVVNSDGIILGVVQDFIETGANDVMVVVGERRRLIPYITQVILSVDLAKKEILVDWDQTF